MSSDRAAFARSRFGIVGAGFFLFFIFAFPLAGQQDCSKCDCNHFPIAKQCYKCCGFATGTITSVSNGRLALSVRDAAGQTATKTFSLAVLPSTNRDLKKGAQATVYYDKKGNLARRIDLTAALQGLLVPATDPSPPLSCGDETIPSGVLRVYLGSLTAITTGDEETLLQVHGMNLLSVRRTAKGIAVNATVFSREGDVAASIVDNHFFVNPDGHFRIQEPDRHTLVVKTKTGEQLIHLRYLNPTALSVVGTFYPPRTKAIIIGEDETRVGGLVLARDCFENVAVVINIR